MDRRSSAAPKWKSMLSRIGTPLMATSRSPARSPARAAGLRGRTWATTTPSADERAGMGLARRGLVPQPRALVEVLDPRRRGEERGRQDEPRHGRRDLEVELEHGGEHGEHLEERRGLPEPGRG